MPKFVVEGSVWFRYETEADHEGYAREIVTMERTPTEIINNSQATELKVERIELITPPDPIKDHAGQLMLYLFNEGVWHKYLKGGIKNQDVMNAIDFWLGGEDNGLRHFTFFQAEEIVNAFKEVSGKHFVEIFPKTDRKPVAPIPPDEMNALEYYSKWHKTDDNDGRFDIRASKLQSSETTGDLIEWAISCLADGFGREFWVWNRGVLDAYEQGHYFTERFAAFLYMKWLYEKDSCTDEGSWASFSAGIPYWVPERAALYDLSRELLSMLNEKEESCEKPILF